jgi:hypothetical protein
MAAAEWHAKEFVDRLRSAPGAGGSLPRHSQIVAFHQGIPVQTSYRFQHALE